MEAINIYPELVTSRINSQNMAAIIIRIDRKREHIGRDNIGHKVKVDHWDPVKKRVRSKDPNFSFLNSVIENAINRHRNFILKRQAFGLPVTKEIISQYLKSNSAYDSVYEYASRVIENKKLKDGKGYSKDTKRRYRDEIKRLMQHAPELHFNQITVQFLTRYKEWMQNSYQKKDKGALNKNSIWKALGFLRMIYNEAIKDEVILPDANPFRQFKVGSYEQDLEKVKFLDISQLESIEKILITDKDLPKLTHNVGWRFLAMCVSGLRISDAMILDDYFFNDAGDLEFRPFKTRRHDNKAHIPITTERQRRYFSKTLQHCLPQTDSKSFRTTFNIHLKILAAKAGININLTSHIGRHTMGGFIVDAGIETKPAMAMFGVKSKKTIETYLHLKKEKLRKEADKLKSIF